jgi:hypothetical protein
MVDWVADLFKNGDVQTVNYLPQVSLVSTASATCFYNY